MLPVYEELLTKKLRILVFSGDVVRARLLQIPHPFLGGPSEATLS